MVVINLVPEDADDPVVAAIFDTVRHGGRPVPDLYRALGNAPAMLRAWTGLAWPLRSAANTSRGLRELMIMRVAVLTRAAFEWEAHWPAAVGAGVRTAQLRDLNSWATSQEFSEVERAALRCVDEMIHTGAATKDAVAELRTLFTDGEVVELVLTAGFYSCVSHVLLTLGVEAESTDDEATAIYRELTDSSA